MLKIKLPQILKHLFYIWIFFLEKDVYGNLTTKLDVKRDDFFIFFFWSTSSTYLAIYHHHPVTVFMSVSLFVIKEHANNLSKVDI